MSVLTRIRSAVAGIALVAGLATPLMVNADTLADAMVGAYRSSNLLEQNRALLRAADEDVQQAIAALYPVVNFAVTATAGTTGLTDSSINAGLTASMTLIDFGRNRRSLDMTRESVLATRAALVGIEQNVILGAVQAYLGLYNQLQTVQLQRNNVSVINEQLRAARERFELGDSTRTDVALAEARLAASRSALAAAEGDVAIAREQYNFAVGAYPASISAPPRLPQLPSSLEAAQDLARRNHPAITQAQHLVASSEIGMEVARLQRLGEVSGSLSAGLTGTQGPSSNSNSVSASLSYQVPLFTAGRLSSVERQALAGTEAQRASLHQTVATVQQSVASNWARLSVARATLLAGDQQIRAAQSAYDAVSAEAELGSRTTLDVLDAEQELLDARSSRILAAANVQLAAYALLNSMGQLTVTALNLGIPTYDVSAYSSTMRQGPARVTPSTQGQALDRIMDRYR
ncbi:TolC family outer membrane protein [Pararhodobacter zhoushanensis]|uniref:TolC family outer membrane protein n=1 Tax=Pararhodobacter zhoushanensis TaxID=2479545 RepID=UPI000F8E94A9|nr:TolC family outer membrane protein [Pararhodobacter zhoushanensis]